MTTIEYIAGHWIPFTSNKALDTAQWSVVDAYANFTAAALAVYTTRSVASLATVVSPQSKVTNMFEKDLASRISPEALYTEAAVKSVSIHGCRASLALILHYPNGRRLNYISSWLRPFDTSIPGLVHHRGSLLSPPKAGASDSAASNQYAPWLFVGDNRVGGLDTPCGI